jgi:hypothetical protein
MIKTHVTDQITKAMADKKAATAELVQYLRSLPVHQLAQELPAVVGRFTQAELFAILRVKREPVMAVNPTPVSSTTSDLFPDFLIRLRQISPSILALSAAVVVMVASSLVASGAHWLGGEQRPFSIDRPIRSELWPPCPRLSDQVDGCLYRVQSGISLSDAAEALDLPLAQLRTVNPQFPASQISLQSGSRLVVWRGLGSLHQ